VACIDIAVKMKVTWI